MYLRCNKYFGRRGKTLIFCVGVQKLSFSTHTLLSGGLSSSFARLCSATKSGRGICQALVVNFVGGRGPSDWLVFHCWNITNNMIVQVLHPLKHVSDAGEAKRLLHVAPGEALHHFDPLRIHQHQHTYLSIKQNASCPIFRSMGAPCRLQQWPGN